MKQSILYMVKKKLGIFLVILIVANATAQKTLHPIVIEECETLELSVVDMMGDEYTWDFFEDSTANFAVNDDRLDPLLYFDDGDYRDSSSVIVTGLSPGRYFLRVTAWDEQACTNNLIIFFITVIEHFPEATVIGDSLCYDDPVVFKIILTGYGPWDVKYTYGNDNTVVNLNGITEPEQTIKLPPLPVGTTDIWVQEIIDQCSSNIKPSEKGRIVIFPIPTNSKIYPVNK